MQMKMIDKKLFKIELILFTISSLLGMCFLFVNKLEPFGDLLLTTYDANVQYLDFFLYYKKLLSSGFKTFYSMGMTLGDSTISVFAYYLASPFNLLFLLFDNENIGACFNIVVVLKIILSILTCSIFLYFHSDKKIDILIMYLLSISYGFMQYNIAQSNNILWLDGVYMLPIILIGIETVFRKNKISFCLTMSVCLSIIFNWYTGAINCIFSVFYFIFLLIHDYITNIDHKRYIVISSKLILTMLFGVLLSMCLFMPSTISLLSGRGGVELFELRNEMLSNPLNSFFNYTINGRSDKTTGVSLYAGSFIFFGVIGMLCTQNIANKKERLLYIFTFIFFILIYYYRPLFFLFSLFKESSSFYFRYSYVTILFFVILSYEFYQKNFNVIDKKTCYIFFLVILIQCICIKTFTNNEIKYIVIWFVFATINLLFIYMKSSIKKWDNLCSILLLTVLTCELIYNTKALIINNNHYIFKYEYTDYYLRELETINNIIKNDDGYYRIAQTSYRNTENNLTANYNEALGYDFWSNAGYTSDPDNTQRVFLEKIGYRKNGPNFNVTNTSILASDSLLGVKYILSEYDINGTTLINEHTVANFKNVYYNQFALPMAFGIKDINTDKIEYDNNPFLYVNSLYSKLVGYETDIYKPIEYDCYGDNHYRDFILKIDGNSNPVYGNFVWDYMFDGMLYIQNGLEIPYSQTLSPSVFYIPTGKDTVTSKITIEGQEWISGEAQFYYLDLNEFKKVINDLKRNSVEELIVDDGNIKCKYYAKKDGYIFISVPKNKGWKIYNNGKEAEIEYFEDCLYLIRINEGKNEIEMRFSTPYIKEGALVSIVSAMIYIAIYKKGSGDLINKH